jgi:hypothetical protein
MAKEYEQFVVDLNKSQAPVMAVAAYLQRKEMQVVLPPHRVVPKGVDNTAYKDNGDLFVMRAMQVKGSSREFDSVGQFPFRNPIVDEAYKIDEQIKSPPMGYWILNKSLTGALYIPWETKPKWGRFTSVDKKQGGRVCEFYTCPKEYCQYREL